MNSNAESLRVHLAACASTTQDSPAVHAWQKAADKDVYGIHQLTTDPAQADLILFVDLHLSPDWRLAALVKHELVQEFSGKVLVYNERDHPWCAWPGLYCSMPEKHFDAQRQRACVYYGAVSFTDEERTGTRPDLLFSFMGSRSHPMRNNVLRLEHPRAVVKDTSGFVFYDRSQPEAYDRQKARYLSTLLRSKFVLCPRGAGTGSIRLFETLAAGRVPVIISDQWMPPAGPDWNKLSLRVSESEVGTLPHLLEATEENYPQMAAAAQAAHQEWFSQRVIFHRLISECAELLRGKQVARPNRRGLHYVGLGMREAKHQVRGSIGRFLRASGLR